MQVARLLQAPAGPREFKRAPAHLLTTDSNAGVFEGYASMFGKRDLGGDIVVRGAFRETLLKRGVAGIKLLWQHDPVAPVGTWLSIQEDARGLRVRGRLNLALARAREALVLMREGALDGLSIGFRTELATRDAWTGARLLQRVDLWEISLVTFPMAPDARVTAVKSVGVKPLEFLTDRARRRTKETGLRLEAGLRQAAFECRA